MPNVGRQHARSGAKRYPDARNRRDAEHPAAIPRRFVLRQGNRLRADRSGNRAGLYGRENPHLLERARSRDGLAARVVFRRIRDRKSTRLNSSHGYISYAVFCLKKKTKNTTANYIKLSTPTHTTT